MLRPSGRTSPRRNSSVIVSRLIATDCHAATMLWISSADRPFVPEKLGLWARPHPNLLPRGEGTAMAHFQEFGWLSGKSSRTIIQGDGERFSFSPGEKAGMRESVIPTADLFF